MRVELRDEARRRIGRIEVDPAERPTRVRIEGGERDVFLTWDSAVDDSGRLRRCVACGCPDLYKVRAFPPLTGFVVVLAFAGAVIGVLGFATNPVVFGALIGVLVLDIASLVFARYRLVCHRCGSTYSSLEIARHHRPWDRAVAERYSAAAPLVAATSEPNAPFRRRFRRAPT
jgi:hypothetical protein